ncbi:hypothetical protein [Pseudonocardia alaniniphila]|uniref:hypothetical protein n=1 Tax=Pseudonocardia alaniniphila TaxID=75291 RepID=UPI0031E34C28
MATAAVAAGPPPACTIVSATTRSSAPTIRSTTATVSIDAAPMHRIAPSVAGATRDKLVRLLAVADRHVWSAAGSRGGTI